MKYIKLYESSNTVIVCKVTFDNGGDTVSGLYIDNLLETHGDWYHHKIDDYIDGFISGLRWIKKGYVYPLNVVVNEMDCEDDDLNEKICDYAAEPPRNLSDIRGKYTKLDIYKDVVNEELLGIGTTIRRSGHKDELEGEEIKYTIKAGLVKNIIKKVKKKKDKHITSFTFEMKRHKIRCEFINWIHPIKTPGFSEYEVYMDDKNLDISRKISKEIFKMISSI